MRRWRATTAGAVLTVIAVLAGIVAVRVALPSPTPHRLAAAPESLRLEPASPDGAGAASTAGGDVGGGATDATGAAGSDAAGLIPPPPPPGPGETVIAPPPATFDAPPAPPAPPPEELRRTAGVQPSGGVWAVIIGIDDYPGSSHDLRSAVADANDMNEALARYAVPGDHRLLVRNGQATAGVVLAAADWLVARAGTDATAVFFYAGHVRKVASTTEAIVAADGRTVTDAQLADHLRGLQARHTWLAIAACFGGGFTEALGPGRVLTAAAGPNSYAYESAAYGRSYMVEFMVREAMIEGKAPQSVQASFAYAKAELDRQYPGRAPVEYDESGGPVDLRWPSGTYTPAPPPAGPPPAAGGGSGPPSATNPDGGPGSSDPRCTSLGVVSLNCP